MWLSLIGVARAELRGGTVRPCLLPRRSGTVRWDSVPSRVELRLNPVRTRRSVRVSSAVGSAQLSSLRLSRAAARGQSLPRGPSSSGLSCGSRLNNALKGLVRCSGSDRNAFRGNAFRANVFRVRW